MKKIYIKPELREDWVELGPLLSGSDFISGDKDGEGAEEDDFGSKDREDSEWGALW